MKKITSEQFLQLRSKKKKHRRTKLEIHLDGLEIGEGLEIEKKEWHFKAEPSMWFYKMGKKLGKHYKTRTLQDNRGYAILRTN